MRDASRLAGSPVHAVPVALLLAAALLAAACGPDRDVSEEEMLEGPVTEVALGEAVISLEANEEGHAVPGTEGDTFTVGDNLHLSLGVANVPAGTDVGVQVYDPAGTRIVDAAQTRQEHQGRMTFTTTDTSGWVPGEYRAEIRIAGEKARELGFTMTPGPEGAGS